MFYITCIALGATAALITNLLPESWDKPLITIHNPFSKEA